MANKSKEESNDVLYIILIVLFIVVAFAVFCMSDKKSGGNNMKGKSRGVRFHKVTKVRTFDKETRDILGNGTTKTNL